MTRLIFAASPANFLPIAASLALLSISYSNLLRVGVTVFQS
jgi:hypothetical protein